MLLSPGRENATIAHGSRPAKQDENAVEVPHGVGSTVHLGLNFIPSLTGWKSFAWLGTQDFRSASRNSILGYSRPLPTGRENVETLGEGVATLTTARLGDQRCITHA
jgi:hypothetical protein